MKRNWLDFAVEPQPLRTGFYASINAQGKVVLNHLLWEELGSPTHVRLLYDEDHLTIGIRKVSRLMPHAFPVVTIPPEGRGTTPRYWIRGRNFIDAARLRIDYCIRFLDPHLEEDTLILDLNHTARVLGPRR